FFKVFNKRQDFERFLDFYDDTVVLEDIINGDRIEGKQALRSFFDWSNPDFELLEESSLVVNEITVDDNRVVVSGYFTPFKWGDTEFEAMHFTTLLTLNESGKIIKQVDWINYPSNLVNYNTRKNSNTWLK
ncbi:MAG: nuclear transport factor 2 family protein, partial [Allomuricauda sp.]